MSSAILAANLPILVPPNFCTIHLAEGSTVFWCKLGGVPGGGVRGCELELEGLGVDASDMTVTIFSKLYDKRSSRLTNESL
jgi:hypothetical protein